MKSPWLVRFGSALSHSAVWPGVYVAASVAYVAQLAGARLDGRAWAGCIAMALATGVGTYLLDRVKARDAWLDPADAEAVPARDAFVRKHAWVLRITAVLLVLGASALGFFASRAGLARAWVMVMPVVSGVGVLAYAGRPRSVRPRIKDVLLVKNGYVAGGITAFALLMAWGWSAGGVSRDAQAAWGLAGVTLAVRVMADAVLCDLDDEHADAKHGTRTVPGRIGREAAWNAAMVSRLVLAGVMAAAPIGDWRVRVVWAGVTAASSVGLRMMRPGRVRDWVDGRFGAEASVVWVVMAMLGS